MVHSVAKKYGVNQKKTLLGAEFFIAFAGGIVRLYDHSLQPFASVTNDDAESFGPDFLKNSPETFHFLVAVIIIHSVRIQRSDQVCL